MFLGAYHFHGDPAVLLAGYERLMSSFPEESLDLHVCIVHEHGMTVYDACPSRAVHAEFSGGAAFAATIAAAGLPSPRVEPLGDVHAVRVGEAAVR